MLPPTTPSAAAGAARSASGSGTTSSKMRISPHGEFSRTTSVDKALRDRCSDDSLEEQSFGTSDMLTSVSGTWLKRTSSSSERGPSEKKLRRSSEGSNPASLLRQLYGDVEGRHKVVFCKHSVKSGVPELDASGKELSIFGVRHSKKFHAKNDQHIRAIAHFPFRKSKVGVEGRRPCGPPSCAETGAAPRGLAKVADVRRYMLPSAADPLQVLKLSVSNPVVMHEFGAKLGRGEHEKNGWMMQDHARIAPAFNEGAAPSGGSFWGAKLCQRLWQEDSLSLALNGCTGELLTSGGE